MRQNIAAVAREIILAHTPQTVATVAEINSAWIRRSLAGEAPTNHYDERDTEAIELEPQPVTTLEPPPAEWFLPEAMLEQPPAEWVQALVATGGPDGPVAGEVNLPQEPQAPEDPDREEASGGAPATASGDAPRAGGESEIESAASCIDTPEGSEMCDDAEENCAPDVEDQPYHPFVDYSRPFRWSMSEIIFGNRRALQRDRRPSLWYRFKRWFTKTTTDVRRTPTYANLCKPHPQLLDHLRARVCPGTPRTQLVLQELHHKALRYCEDKELELNANQIRVTVIAALERTPHEALLDEAAKQFKTE